MRRRDPDCMRIADNLPTDKPRFEDVYGYDFSVLREGDPPLAHPAGADSGALQGGRLPVRLRLGAGLPLNAAFFAFALSQLQASWRSRTWSTSPPRAVIYVAPPSATPASTESRWSYIAATRTSTRSFSYNLYPGPSAKKGIYSVLLDIGEQEGWVTAHASAARIITPTRMRWS